MAQTDTPEMFVPELQLQILLNVQTPEDLHSLIQASPRTLQVFLLNKATVLSAVARRQFHPAVISDALFFAQISQHEHPLPRDTVLELCETYPSELHEGAVIPIAMSIALCKLARNVKFLIEDYARNTLPLMEELGRSLDVHVLSEYQPENPVSYSQLSDSEVGRLQRAFCRFEIYRYLFARCSPELNHDTRSCAFHASLSPAEQARLFLAKFPDFQITEINCIRDYMFRRLRGICHHLEDQAVESLPVETFQFDQSGDVEAAEWFSGVYLFTNSGKPHQEDHMEHLMSLGLAYICRLFESTGEEQKDLFIRHIPRDVIRHMETQFITKAINSLGRNPVCTELLSLDEGLSFPYDVNAGVDLDVPDAWQWAYPRSPPLDLKDSTLKGLRDWGFVFWDRDRLRESGILEKR